MTQTSNKPAGKKGKGKWQPPKQRRSGAPLLWGLAVLLCVLAVAAVVITRNGDKGDKNTAKATSETAPVTVSGTALPAFPESGTDPAVGKAAPGLRGTDFNGKPVVIAADGRPKLVMFVAHWCPHCQREVPLIAQWLKGGMPAGVELYSVATSTSAQQPNYPPSAWLAREGWPLPVLTDDDASTAAQAYGLTSFPYFVFIDAHGKVAQRLTGEQPVSTVQASLSRIINKAAN